MTKKRIIILFFILLSISSILLILQQTKSTFNEQIKNFAVSDTSTVTKIFLADKAGHQVLLQKNSVDEWTVNKKFKANLANIRILLTTMLYLEVQAPVPLSMQQNVLTRMSATGIKVEIYQLVYRINLFNKIKLFRHERKVKTYYVGDNTQNMLGTYMLMENADLPFILQIPGFNGYLTTRYSPKETDWRDHSLVDLTFNDIKSVEIQFYEEPQNSFRLSKESKKNIQLFSINDNRIIDDIDTFKVYDYLSSFHHLMFESFLNDYKGKDSILRSKPFHLITIINKKNEQIVLKTFHKKALPGEVDFDGKPIFIDRDRLFALNQQTNELVLIQFYVFDRILRPISYFQRFHKL